jgi:hypothetical protein
VGYVFISYSHKDSAYVARLVAHLTKVGIEVWTDRGIEHGAEWARTIERKLRDCAVFVPVMSRNSRDAEWVAKEILFAQQLRKPILPLLLDGQPFLELLDIQYEDVRDGQMPSDAYIARLRALTASTATSPDPPSTTPVANDTVAAPALTLHEAMAAVLQTAPQRMMRARDLATEINERRLYWMRDGRPVEVRQIHARVGHHPHLFVREGTLIKLVS